MKAHLASQTTRFATDRLTALAQAKGAIESPVPEMLFVCEQNAGRSQMAAVLTNFLADGRVHVRSAGSSPSASLNPAVIEVMAELGLDMAEEFPKPLTDDVVQAADVVVTMGCGDACAIYPGKRYLDWELADPAGLSIEEVREIRDEIRQRVDRCSRRCPLRSRPRHAKSPGVPGLSMVAPTGVDPVTFRFSAGCGAA